MDTIWDADLQSAALKAEHHRLKAERLSLGYEGKSVCDALDLAIPHGKFSVIVGPNGCGKSTLLKACAVYSSRWLGKYYWMVRIFTNCRPR